MVLKDNAFKKMPALVTLLQAENARQLKKWGVQTRTEFEWLAYITEELGELSKAISENTYRDGFVKPIINEAIQVATLSLKVAEMYLCTLGRREHELDS